MQKGWLLAKTHGHASGHMQKEGPMGDADEGSGMRHGQDAWGREPNMARGVHDDGTAMVAWKHGGDKPWRHRNGDRNGLWAA